MGSLSPINAPSSSSTNNLDSSSFSKTKAGVVVMAVAELKDIQDSSNRVPEDYQFWPPFQQTVNLDGTYNIPLGLYHTLFDTWLQLSFISRQLV